MKLALVEDQPLLAQNLVRMLAAVPEHSVVATYPNAEAALAELRHGQADLLIVDLDLPGLSGVELIREVRAAPLRLASLVWTIHEDRDVLYAALKAGAVGYLLKGCDAPELAASLREVAAGGAPMSPRIARRVMEEFIGQAEPKPAVELSPREREVLRAIAAGHGYKAIAAQLSLSTHTVHTHVKNIYGKLAAKDRAEALRQAQRLGVIVNW